MSLNQYKNIENIRELQLRTLEVLKVIDEICQKHNINYSLFGGTIIGAIVHNGFIPWDDDIDLVMDRENYNRFKDICRIELPEKYEFKDYFEDDSMFVLFAKIIDSSTTCIMRGPDNTKIITGFFVDITVLDNIPSNIILRKIQYSISLLCLLFVSKTIPKNKGKIIKFISKILICILPNSLTKKVVKYGYRYITSFKRTRRSFLDEIIAINAPKINLPPDTMDSFIKVQFEGMLFPVFSRYHEYLIKRYKRDYTTLPPIEERIPHHKIEFIDSDRSYKEILEKHN